MHERESFVCKLKFDYDNTLILDESIQFDFRFLKQNYYQCKVITNRATGLPVNFEPDLLYDPKIHLMQEYFGKEIIGQMLFHNKNLTLAYTPDAFACYRVHIGSQIRNPEHLLAILSNFLWMRNLTPANQLRLIRGIKCQIVTKLELFNILLILNRKMINPCTDVQLNKLTTYIFQTYDSSKLIPKVKEIKSIRTQSFLKEYTGDYSDIRSAILSEINKIKFVQSQDYYGDIIEKKINLELKKGNVLSFCEMVDFLMSEHKLKNANARKKVYQFEKRYQTATALLNINNNNIQEEYQNDTFSNSESKIANFINKFNGEHLTQNIIAKGTGLGIATIKRHWTKFKERVQLYNKQRKKRKEGGELPISIEVQTSMS